MATINDLIPLIYHEKQEPGSMLCAQHALNALLQANYLTAPDLSAIARELDEEEAQYHTDNRPTGSANMDDTGFFSVQVLEKALQVWGLTLVRWRSERMRPFQDHPHTQIAFILNLQQHWFTLRRFGIPSPDPFSEDGAGVGHWFNLNSSLEAPEWISKLYLGMVLQQAEAEGYSVFAVIQEDSTVPLSLPRSAADNLAAAIPEQAPQSGSRLTTTRTPASQSTSQPSLPEGFEDEDMELQAALQASLMGIPYEYQPPILAPRSAASASGVRTPTQRHTPGAYPGPFVEEEEDSGNDDVVELDPVAASMARNRAMLQRMQREQEAALRESYEEDMVRVETAAARRRTAEDDEDEMLRRAIAESEAMARGYGQAGAAAREDDEDDADDDDEDYAPPVIPPPVSRAPLAPASAHGSYRVYDDEDAELQAALRASLEGMPEAFEIPDSPPRVPLRQLPGVNPPVAPPVVERQPSYASEAETESETEAPQVEQLSVDEIRRRRLARFGG